jgi:hypothetical protein
VILNDIHIDIMDYIKPAYCNEAEVGLFSASLLALGVIRHLDMWLIAHALIVPSSSAACGRNLSGRTVLTSTQRFREDIFLGSLLLIGLY